MMNIKMSTVVMGQVVVDNRDGKEWTIIGKDSKCKTIMMEDKTGFSRTFGLSTVNKNFTEMIEDEEPIQEEEIQEEQETCSDGTTYTEVMEEIIAGAEKKAEKAKKERKPRAKKVPSGAVLNLLSFIIEEWEKVGIIKTPGKENALFRPLCAENGRQVIKLMWTTKKISFFVRVEAATAHAEEWQKINYAMPFQCMFFHDTEETRQNIKDIFQLVLDVDSVRQKKEKKTA